MRTGFFLLAQCLSLENHIFKTEAGNEETYNGYENDSLYTHPQPYSQIQNMTRVSHALPKNNISSNIP